MRRLPVQRHLTAGQAPYNVPSAAPAAEALINYGAPRLRRSENAGASAATRFAAQAPCFFGKRGRTHTSPYGVIPNDVESLPFEAGGPAEPDDRLDEVRMFGQVRQPGPDDAA